MVTTTQEIVSEINGVESCRETTAGLVQDGNSISIKTLKTIKKEVDTSDGQRSAFKNDGDTDNKETTSDEGQETATVQCTNSEEQQSVKQRTEATTLQQDEDNQELIPVIDKSEESALVQGKSDEERGRDDNKHVAESQDTNIEEMMHVEEGKETVKGTDRLQQDNTSSKEVMAGSDESKETESTQDMMNSESAGEGGSAEEDKETTVAQNKNSKEGASVKENRETATALPDTCKKANGKSG